MALINTGLVTANNGLLEVQGAGEALGGTLQANGGTLALVGSFAVASGKTAKATFAGANLGWSNDGAAVLSGPGTLSSSGSVAVTDWGGNTQLELAGGLTWNSAGTVYDYGWTVLTGSSVWNNSGTVYSRYGVQFGAADGDAATIVNGAAGTFDLNAGTGNLSTSNTGAYSFVNKGTLELTAGGSHYVSVALVNTGLVTANNGLLEVQGAGEALGGTLQANGGTLALVGSYSSASGKAAKVTFAGANLGWYGDGAAVLSGPGTLSSSGSVAVTDWGGNTQLELAGGLTWNSAGTVYDYGWTVLTGSSVWNNSGTVYSRYGVQFGAADGDAATIVNNTSAIFDLDGSGGNLSAANGGTYSFVNKGTLELTSSGSHYVNVPLINTGLVAVDAGTLSLTGSITNKAKMEATGSGSVLNLGYYLTNSGVLQADNYGYVDVTGAVAGGSALISGAGATLEFAAAISNTAVTFGSGAAGRLKLDASSAFAGNIAGFAAGDTIDLTDINFGELTKQTFVENAARTSGQLTLSDGTHTATITLLGQYAAAGFSGSAAAAGFTITSDGAAGTTVGLAIALPH